MPLIKCKCGRNTTYGLTCTNCRTTAFGSSDKKTEEAEFHDDLEPGFHEVELDEDFNEDFDYDD